MKKSLLLLAIFFISCGQKTTDITLIHVNDTHSKHIPTVKTDKASGIVSTNGGSAQLASMIKKLKSENPTALAIHGGDAVTGSSFSLIYQGTDSTDILNMSDFDLAVLGNHEFDFGLQQAYHIITNRNFPTITVNAYEKESGKQIVPSTYSTNINGKSIGFIGLLTSHEVYTLKDKPNQFIVSNEISSLSNLLQIDKNIQTNDLLILVSHIGYELDQEIARLFPNIFDIIIGGHSHTPLSQPTKINKTLIVQTDSNIKELGKLDLKINNNNDIVSYHYQVIPLKNIEPDNNITEYLNTKQGLVNQKMGEVLATISDTLEDSNIRMESTTLGNMITDLAFDNFQDKGMDVLMLNSGGIRSTLNEGNITLGNMYEIHPFDNTIVYFETTGKTLKEILYHSANSVRNTGGFLQLSKNISVTVAKDRTIGSVKIHNQEIDDNKLYKIMVSDWTFNGGDSYTMIKPNAQNIQYLGFDVRDALIDQLKKLKRIDTTSLNTEKRWIFE